MAIHLRPPRLLRRTAPMPQADAGAAEDRLTALLRQECAALAVQYRTSAEFGRDPSAGFWLRLAEWPLPDGLGRAGCPLIALVPPDYPAVAPTTLFLPADVAAPAGWTPSRLLPAGDDVAAPENWQACAAPSVGWRSGDDLERLLATLRTVLEAAQRLVSQALPEN